MKKLSFILVLLLVSTYIVFAQEKPLRGYSLFEHNPKEGVYKRFFGENSYDKAPIQEFYVVQNEEGGIELYVGFVGDASNLMKKHSEEKVEKSPVLEGKQSTIYTYIFSGTPITINIIEVYTLSTKKTECLISFKSYNEIIYFAKARKIAKAKMEKIIKDQLVKERAKAEEQKRIEEEKRQREERQKEEKRQELLKREKEIERILPIIDQTNISYAVNDFYNKKYFEEMKSDDNVLTLRKLEFNGDIDVLLKVDTVGVDVVKIGEEIVNAELNILYPASTKYCTFNGVDYYKYQGYIFCHKKIYFEKGYGGLKNKGGKFEYYKSIPDNVRKECKLNFTKRGEYFFEYTIIGDDVSVKELSSLERKQKDEMRGRKTTGRMILNLGCGALLLGVLAVGAAL